MKKMTIDDTQTPEEVWATLQLQIHDLACAAVDAGETKLPVTPFVDPGNPLVTFVNAAAASLYCKKRWDEWTDELIGAGMLLVSGRYPWLPISSMDEFREQYLRSLKVRILVATLCNAIVDHMVANEASYAIIDLDEAQEIKCPDDVLETISDLDECKEEVERLVAKLEEAREQIQRSAQ